jgi:uncharacterized protein (DUF1501 family)
MKGRTMTMRNDRAAFTSTLISRRRLLQGALAAGAVAAVDLSWLTDSDAAGPPLGPTDRVLVTVQLDGGNCGLNTLVPYTDAAYYGLRGPLAIAANAVLPVGDGLGLHPALAYTKARFDSDNVAIVRGVGHVDGDLSHFSAMAKLASGGQGSESFSTGWLGRYLDGIGANGFGGIAVGDSVIPLLLRGANAPVTVLPAFSDGLFGADRTTFWDRTMFESVGAMNTSPSGRGRFAAAVEGTFSSAVADATEATPVYVDVPTGGDLVRKLALAARVINLDVGARVVHVVLSGFDTHSGQLVGQDTLLRSLDDGLRTFFDTLLPQFGSRVVVVAFSEFGRRPRANDSGGTDHGTASVALVMGERVRGGLWGAQPSLTSLDPNGNLVPALDTRSVFASLLAKWLHADDRQIFGRTFDQLDLIHESPSCAPMSTNLRGSSSSYVSAPPVRLLDSRVGNGIAKGKLGAGALLHLYVLGRGLVPPTGVSAVVLNVTVAEPTSGGYLTIWPSGAPQPEASSLNFTTGQTVPNLVIAPVSDKGTVAIYNGGGDAHVIADVCGWFPTGNPYQPVTPVRLLDSRNHVAASGKLGPDATLRLQVAGRGGVPSRGAGSVVLNVTGTEPDSISYLTVWPSDAPRPTASNLNLVPDRTTPNLVISKLAADGTVSIYNAAGQVHVLADVCGWFPPDAGYHPMVPTRIVDTRIGTGARGRLRANATIDLDTLCRGSVPVNASAVVLNVTVAEPTLAGYLTVWPSGQPQPNASNLNFAAGQVVPNLVIVRVGVEGMISVYNEVGTPHVIADVMGWFE